MGVVMAGIGGFNSGFDEEIDSNAQTLAGIIIALCLLVLGINIAGMCILCTYGTYFGVVMTQRRTAVIITQSNTGNTNVMTYNTTGMTAMGTNNAQLESLQAQNRLLQQQIDLQQQLINQQQQQQQQTQYGFQAPPAYPPNPAYPPTAPPPSYDKVA